MKITKDHLKTWGLFAVLGIGVLACVYAVTLRLEAATKCEKCVRGPDGKIKCEPVPCPK